MSKIQLSTNTLMLIMYNIEPHLNGALDGYVDDLGFVVDHLLTDIRKNLTEAFEIKPAVFINKGSIEKQKLKFLLSVYLSPEGNLLLPCHSPNIALMKSLEAKHYLNAKLTYKENFWELWLTSDGIDYLQKYSNSNSCEDTETSKSQMELESIANVIKNLKCFVCHKNPELEEITGEILNKTSELLEILKANRLNLT